MREERREKREAKGRELATISNTYKNVGVIGSLGVCINVLMN